MSRSVVVQIIYSARSTCFITFDQYLHDRKVFLKLFEVVIDDRPAYGLRRFTRHEGVTLLSTVTMIAYPVLVQLLALDDVAAGVFIGGAIHDVAQIIGAGFSLSDEAGETAKLVKLFQVAMLAPVVLLASITIQRYAHVDVSGSRTPLLPGFVIGFIVLAVVNSIGLVPASVASWIGQSSRWLLLIAIAAAGMKTNLKQVLSVGGPAIAFIVSETVFLACLMLAGIIFLN